MPGGRSGLDGDGVLQCLAGDAALGRQGRCCSAPTRSAWRRRPASTGRSSSTCRPRSRRAAKSAAPSAAARISRSAMRSTREGRPTTDPKAALAGGVVLPIGEHKGSGLSMFMDIFGGVISGANFGGDVGDQYKAFDRPQDVGHFFLAMKPDLFVSEDDYRARIDTLIDRMKSSPLAEGFGRCWCRASPRTAYEAERRRGRHPVRRERGRSAAGRGQARRHPAAGGRGPADRRLKTANRQRLWLRQFGSRRYGRCNTARPARHGIPEAQSGEEQCPSCVPCCWRPRACWWRSTTSAAAQADYPNRPVRLIIPFPPGGSNDVVGRMIGDPARRAARQAGHRRQPRRRRRRGRHRDRLASAPPDGYTLLVISLAHAVNPWLYKLPYDPIKAFAPIGVHGHGPERGRGQSRACR